MKTNDIRQKFIDFFKQHEHAYEPSSPLIPSNDPTLLFTNAGMVPFKHVFLGEETRPYNKAVSAQKCVRAGGKHNDLENVGYTYRHHTFFEMLGNFSFGDYFKREAIHYCWTFLTEVLKLSKDLLWVTVYHEDEKALRIWIDEIGVPADRVIKMGADENFWAMGDTGPCGPCTEVYYDHGPALSGGPPGSEYEGERYVEVWNLVFMQYNRLQDGTMNDLPNPAVDTGMGLERIAAVLQGVYSNYEIDTFQHLISGIATIAQTDKLDSPSLKVIADHIRSCSFLIAEGLKPANEGRGYVLRRIIRRAVRHGYQLGIEMPFFYRMLSYLIDEMGEAYPELVNQKNTIESVLIKEEKQFASTLAYGMKLFNQALREIEGDELSGELAFKLYDTYGFPFDLTCDLAREQGLRVDQAGFNECMNEQKKRAKAANQFHFDYNASICPQTRSAFLGYGQPWSDAYVAEIYRSGQKVSVLESQQKGVVVLNQSPFYSESGGQVGDIGQIECLQGVFKVEDTQKINDAILHYGYMEKGQLTPNEEVTALIDTNRRSLIAHNHSATHLLHAALRQLFGQDVEQQGSLVDEHKLRFDFNYDSALSFDEIRAIESLVNERIRQNDEAETILTTVEHARQLGALGLFEHKYGETVRVLRLGDFSIELCGGTHVKRTGDIGYFKITDETGVASGIRRLTAVTGAQAEKYMAGYEKLVNDIAVTLKTSSNTVLARIESLIASNRHYQKEVESLKYKLARNQNNPTQAGIAGEKIGQSLVYAEALPEVDMKTLRQRIDELKSKHANVIAVAGTTQNNKVLLAAGVSKALTDQINASSLINHVASHVGGKGGGRPDMAQAGGNQPENFESALNSVKPWVKSQLN